MTEESKRDSSSEGERGLGPSADLDRARAIAARLRGEPTAFPHAPPALSPATARQARAGARMPGAASHFSAAELIAQASAAPPVAALQHDEPTITIVAEPDFPGEPFEREDWPGRLGRAVERAGASSGFVIDDSGLLIACAGKRSGQEMEAVGARLVIAFLQGDRMAGDQHTSRSIAVDLGGEWLTGLRLRLADGPVLTAGLITPGPLDEGTRSTVHDLLAPQRPSRA